jgi:peptidylprolyl isomerase
VGSQKPPTALESRDLIEGVGRPARNGDDVTVEWVEASYAHPDSIIDTTWENSSPDTFTVGTRQVIRGFDLGVVGMRQGGRRELIIPAALAFRPLSDVTIVVVVDLLKIGEDLELPKPPGPGPVQMEPKRPARITAGPIPPPTTTAALRIALDDVVDPAPQSLEDPTGPGVRWVELRFDVTNEESSTFHDLEPSYDPALQFFVDVAGAVGHAPPMFEEQYSPSDNYIPSGSPPCTSPAVVGPRATSTYCLGVQLPTGVPLLDAAATLRLGLALTGDAGEWRIARSPTTPTILPATPTTSSSVAHLDGTLTVASPPLSPLSSPPTVRITLDQVIDPGAAPEPPPWNPLPKDERFVDLRVTMSNIGDVFVPCSGGQEYVLTITWEIDSTESVGGNGYLTHGPPEPCRGLVPGATSTGDIVVIMPVGVPVTNVVVFMGYAGAASGSEVEWFVL